MLYIIDRDDLLTFLTRTCRLNKQQAEADLDFFLRFNDSLVTKTEQAHTHLWIPDSLSGGEKCACGLTRGVRRG